MGLFKNNDDTYTCKLCGHDVSDDFFNHEFGICGTCLVLSEVRINSLKTIIPDLQEKANAASTPGEKITFLSLMLEELYKYKILYVENDVHLIDEDVDDLIFEVIDCISEARL